MSLPVAGKWTVGHRPVNEADWAQPPCPVHTELCVHPRVQPRTPQGLPLLSSQGLLVFLLRASPLPPSSQMPCGSLIAVCLAPKPIGLMQTDPPPCCPLHPPHPAQQPPNHRNLIHICGKTSRRDTQGVERGEGKFDLIGGSLSAKERGKVCLKDALLLLPVMIRGLGIGVGESGEEHVELVVMSTARLFLGSFSLGLLSRWPWSCQGGRARPSDGPEHTVRLPLQWV